MAKKHYKFNEDTLSFDIVQTTLRAKLKRAVYMFFVGSIVAVVWLFIYTRFFDTPKEMRLKEANYSLLVSYEMLDRKMSDANRVLSEIQDRDNKIYRAVFEEMPIPSSIRESGMGGATRYAKFAELENAATVIATVRQLDRLIKKAYIQSKSFDLIASLAGEKERMLVSMPIGIPVDLTKVRLTSHFGGRTDPVFGGHGNHQGIDLAGSKGTPIYASGDGVVIQADYSMSGYGNTVDISHGFGYSTRYAHLASITVYIGKRVKRGELIGTLGSTGKSTGPHLHYEVRLRNQPLNPLNFFENKLDVETAELLVDENESED